MTIKSLDRGSHYRKLCDEFEAKVRATPPWAGIKYPDTITVDDAKAIIEKVRSENHDTLTRTETFCPLDDLAVTPVRVQILEEGARLTNGNRNISYGPPKVNLAAAGELKAVFRKHMTRALSNAELEAVDMVLTKLGRVATGPAPMRDTYVDGATYFAIAGEIALDLS